jgi:hypothetical protein
MYELLFLRVKNHWDKGYKCLITILLVKIRDKLFLWLDKTVVSEPIVNSLKKNSAS